MPNIFLRALLLYLACLVVVRLMGKRQVGQLQPFDLVITILVAQLAASPMSDHGIPLIFGLIPLFAILLIHQALASLMMHFPLLRTWISGKPSLLIQQGEVQAKAMRNQLMNMDDLISQLRSAGFVRVQDIEAAMIEPNGQLSVLPTVGTRPVTPNDMSLQPAPDSLPVTLITDGRLYSNNLKPAGKDEAWLLTELKKQGCLVADVLLAQYFPATGELHVQRKQPPKKASS